MIIVLKESASNKQIDALYEKINKFNVKVEAIEGSERSVLGLVGFTAEIPIDIIKSYDAVSDVFRVSDAFKLSSRHFHPRDSVFKIRDHKIGKGNFTIMAGPCSVESEEQIISTAKAVKKAGAHFLRGGAFKPRTSPYAFQGHGAKGIEWLKEASNATDLGIVTELVSIPDIPLFEKYVDIIQIGARNMQNYQLLKAVGKTNIPVLLKRGLSGTIDELLMASDYILNGGNKKVILCERGIRTYETATRNTLDVSAIPVLRKKSHLPIIVDPSHAAGNRDYVESMSLSAIAAGADGLIIETHLHPDKALSDGAQSVTPNALKTIIDKALKIKDVIK